MFTAVLFTIANIWKQLSTDECICVYTHTHTHTHNELLTHHKKE